MVTGLFPSVFKEGWLRLNKKNPFLSGADGVVSKGRVASLYARVAFLILFEITLRQQNRWGISGSGKAPRLW